MHSRVLIGPVVLKSLRSVFASAYLSLKVISREEPFVCLCKMCCDDLSFVCLIRGLHSLIVDMNVMAVLGF